MLVSQGTSFWGYYFRSLASGLSPLKISAMGHLAVHQLTLILSGILNVGASTLLRGQLKLIGVGCRSNPLNRANTYFKRHLDGPVV